MQREDFVLTEGENTDIYSKSSIREPVPFLELVCKANLFLSAKEPA